MAPSKKPDALAPAAGDASGDAGETQQVEPEAPAVERMFISAGVASDLAMQGWAGDPTTGGILRRNEETGEVTFTPRDGEPRTVEI